MTLRAKGAEPRATGWRDNKEGKARASTAARRDAFFLRSWKTPYRLWVLSAKKETLRLRVANRRPGELEILVAGDAVALQEPTESCQWECVENPGWLAVRTEVWPKRINAGSALWPDPCGAGAPLHRLAPTGERERWPAAPPESATPFPGLRQD